MQIQISNRASTIGLTGDPIRAHTLIAAPTGSGKTLAAFLALLDALFKTGLNGKLIGEIYVVYVSPLKALSNDLHKNLVEPPAEIRDALKAAGELAGCQSRFDDIIKSSVA